uniref:Potassium/proton antiporter CemA n=1 Tax=Neocystis brevis TaxID=1065496 RepID=A0A097KMI1_9CHLO|nr:chloroplast enveloppe membrane protein [Neocystis brevis]AIT94387.1 chloroplast enveloppe membrane protein [Neocystis brevis]
MAKQAFEQTGLIPRSIIRTFDRFRTQLLPDAKKLVVQEFRISRYQVLVSVKCLASLIFIPILVNFLLKFFLLTPLTEYFWNNFQNDIFLNSYQQNRAFVEMLDFEEKTYFDFLIQEPISSKKTLNESLFLLRFSSNFKKSSTMKNDSMSNIASQMVESKPTLPSESRAFSRQPSQSQEKSVLNYPSSVKLETSNSNHISVQTEFKEKTMELALRYNKQSVEALTNVFGDFLTFVTLSFLIIWMKPQIIILKSFLTESIYSLNDTTKSFLLILGTDLLVGFHSPHGWEIFLELILRHFGLPENQEFVFLFVATFPVLLDTVFKYWIFRYLNQISPSTVATYHSMIE